MRTLLGLAALTGLLLLAGSVEAATPTPGGLAHQLCAKAQAKYPAQFAAKYHTVAQCVKIATPLAALGLKACESLGKPGTNVYAACANRLVTGKVTAVGGHLTP